MTVHSIVGRLRVSALAGPETSVASPGPASLVRMFGPRDNPNARNLFSVIHHLQATSGVSLHVRVR